MKTLPFSLVKNPGNPSAPPASGFDEFVEDEGINLLHYWRVILRYKWGILSLAFAVGLFTAVWAHSLQPVYRSTATLLIGGNETVATSSQNDSQDWYAKEPFVDVLPAGVFPQTRTVKGANRCQISIQVPQDRDTVVVTATIDNLVKGASGQAIQNMNIMLGLDEEAGLRQVGLLP